MLLDLQRSIDILYLWILLSGIVGTSVAVSAQREGLSSSDDESSYTQDEIDEYMTSICFGGSDYSEPTLPCEVFWTITLQCQTGVNYDPNLNVNQQPWPACMYEGTCQSNEFERTCYCQSQYKDSAWGCYSCYVGHGGAGVTWFNQRDWAALPGLLKEYCDPTIAPTAAFADHMAPMISVHEHTTDSDFSDSLGYGSTDVSLYWAPSRTGADAWSTQLSTIEDWSGDAIDTGRALTPSADTTSVDATSAATTSFTPVTTNSEHATSGPSTSTSLFSTSALRLTVITPPPSVSIVFSDPIKSPSLFDDTNDNSASPKIGINVGRIVGILSVVVVVVNML